MSTHNRIPSLDGARAVSILMVIVCHFHVGEKVLIDYGTLGVRIFFVISGFLITGLLLSELKSTGTISLKDFYLRRAFRILPAYYVFVIVVALLIPTGLTVAHYSDLLPALFYYSNYKQLAWSVAMTWSLSVEEQFYLLWPAALVLLGLARATRCAFAVLLIAPAFRVLSHLHWWPSDPRIAFECTADALATGCLLAIFRDRLWSWSVYRRAIETGLALLLLVAVLLYIVLDQPRAILWDVIAAPLLNVSIAVMLDRCMRFPKEGLAAVLNWKPLVWIGTISYSLYLWQQLFTHGVDLPLATKVGAMFALAALSYYGIERPMLGLRRSIQARLANRACQSRIGATA